MARVSHGARDLLAALICNVDWLQSQLDNSPQSQQVEESLADIETCCERLTGLLEDVLLGTRPEGLEPKVGSVSIGALTTAVLRRLRRRLRASGIRVELSGERDAAVCIDRFLIARVLDRLMEHTIHSYPCATSFVLSMAVEEGRPALWLTRKGCRCAGSTCSSFAHGGCLRTDSDSGRDVGFCETVARTHGGYVVLQPAADVCWLLQLSTKSTWPKPAR